MATFDAIGQLDNPWSAEPSTIDVPMPAAVGFLLAGLVVGMSTIATGGAFADTDSGSDLDYDVPGSELGGWAPDAGLGSSASNFSSTGVGVPDPASHPVEVDAPTFEAFDMDTPVTAEQDRSTDADVWRPDFSSPRDEVATSTGPSTVIPDVGSALDPTTGGTVSEAGLMPTLDSRPTVANPSEVMTDEAFPRVADLSVPAVADLTADNPYVSPVPSRPDATSTGPNPTDASPAFLDAANLALEDLATTDPTPLVRDLDPDTSRETDGIADRTDPDTGDMETWSPGTPSFPAQVGTSSAGTASAQPAPTRPLVTRGTAPSPTATTDIPLADAVPSAGAGTGARPTPLAGTRDVLPYGPVDTRGQQFAAEPGGTGIVRSTASQSDRTPTASAETRPPGSTGPGAVMDPDLLPLVFALSPLSVGINAYENATVIGTRNAGRLLGAGASPSQIAAARNPLNNFTAGVQTLPRASAVDYTILNGPAAGFNPTDDPTANALIQSGISGGTGMLINSAAQRLQTELPRVQQRNLEHYLSARSGTRVTVPRPNELTLALPTRPLPFALAPVAVTTAATIDGAVRDQFGICQPSASDTNNFNTYCDIGLRSLARGVGLQTAFGTDVMLDQRMAGRRLNPVRAFRETLPIVATMGGQNAIAELLTVEPPVDDALFRNLRGGAQFLSDVGTGGSRLLVGDVDPTDSAGTNITRGYSNGVAAIGLPVVGMALDTMDPFKAIENVWRSSNGQPPLPMIPRETAEVADRRLEQASRSLHHGLRQQPVTGPDAAVSLLGNLSSGLGHGMLGVSDRVFSPLGGQEMADSSATHLDESGAAFRRVATATGVLGGAVRDGGSALAQSSYNLIRCGNYACLPPKPPVDTGRPICASPVAVRCIEPGSWTADPNTVGSLREGPLLPGHPRYAAAVAAGTSGDQSSPSMPGYGRNLGVGLVGVGIVGDGTDRAFAEQFPEINARQSVGYVDDNGSDMWSRGDAEAMQRRARERAGTAPAPAAAPPSGNAWDQGVQAVQNWTGDRMRDVGNAWNSLWNRR